MAPENSSARRLPCSLQQVNKQNHIGGAHGLMGWENRVRGRQQPFSSYSGGVQDLSYSVRFYSQYTSAVALYSGLMLSAFAVMSDGAVGRGRERRGCVQVVAQATSIPLEELPLHTASVTTRHHNGSGHEQRMRDCGVSTGSRLNTLVENGLPGSVIAAAP